MKRKTFFVILLLAIATLITVTSEGDATATTISTIPAQPTPAAVKTIKPVTVVAEYDGREVTRSPEEWNRLLTQSEYYVLREDGTEKAYTGALLENKKKGTYHCAACGLALFKSETKYDSETGWPSFYQPIYKKNVLEKEDRLLGELRTEVECARCGSHIGHVFDDGPEPTGLRYCMNSVSLKFKPSSRK